LISVLLPVKRKTQFVETDKDSTIIQIYPDIYQYKTYNPQDINTHKSC